MLDGQGVKNDENFLSRYHHSALLCFLKSFVNGWSRKESRHCLAGHHHFPVCGIYLKEPRDVFGSRFPFPDSYDFRFDRFKVGNVSTVEQIAGNHYHGKPVE